MFQQQLPPPIEELSPLAEQLCPLEVHAMAFFALHQSEEQLALAARYVSQDAAWLTRQRHRTRQGIRIATCSCMMWRIRLLRKRINWTLKALHALQVIASSEHLTLQFALVDQRAAEALLRLALFQVVSFDIRHPDWRLLHQEAASALRRLNIGCSNTRALLRAYSYRIRNQAQQAEGGQTW